MFIDTHAHLQDKAFAADFDAVLIRAQEQRVNRIIVPGIDVRTSQIGIELAAIHKGIFPAVGIHPHDAEKASADALRTIERMAFLENVVAVGEIGLDFHYNFSRPEVQIAFFEAQIDIALKAGKPIIVHSREAQKEMIGILRDRSAFQAGGVIHCFTGTLAEALTLTDMGFYLGFTGIATFPKSEEMRTIIREIPIERILSETDCPYLSPQKYRGKRNEPVYLPDIVQLIASVKHIPYPEEIARILLENACRCFRRKLCLG